MKRTVRNSIPNSSYNPFSPTAPAGLGVSIHEDAFEQGLVIDVITNDEHELYKRGDGYNVGMVQFRLKSNEFAPKSLLPWANPLFSNFSEYPLKSEIVYIFKSMNRWWYLTKFNVSNRVTTQDLRELLNETDVQKTDADRSKEFRNSNVTKTGDTVHTNIIGNYFADLPNVYRLKHLEGDMILESRSGSSIRFGTSWLNGSGPGKKPFRALHGDQNPNILIRVGADPQAAKSVNSTFGLVVEDINTDASSIWITSDQVIDLNYATLKSDIHGKSVPDFPKQLQGNQIVLNTDRFVVNAKTNKIIGTSLAGIHWTTTLNFTVDAQQDYISFIGRDVGLTVGHDRLTRIANDDSTIVENNESIHAKNIYLTSGETTYIGAQKDIGIFAGNTIAIKGSKVIIGDSQSTEEPMVCGNSLAAFLGALIDALVGNPVPTAAPTPGVNAFTHILTTGAPGSPSAINPVIVASLLKLKADVLNGGGSYASFNSRLGFVKKLP